MSNRMKYYVIGLSIAIAIYVPVVSWLTIRDIIVPPELIDTIILFILASATIFYAVRTSDIADATIEQAKATKQQAEASVKMAKEMREQRRPIVVPKAFPAIGVPLQASVEDIAKHVYSDYFEIHNEGYGPAIELEILLLDKEKRQLEKQRETFFPKVSASPLEFHPNGLTNHMNSTCYLLCRYRGVISSDEAQLWYETWLPFVPVKSQRGDRIIIEPKELEFSETHKKESY